MTNGSTGGTHETHNAAHTPRDPQLNQLEQWVREGSIETLMVGFADMQGRLMGKRART